QYGDVLTFVLFGRHVTVALGSQGGKSTTSGAEEGEAFDELPFKFYLITTPVFSKDVVYDIPNHIFMEQKKFIKVSLTTNNFRKYADMIVKEAEAFWTATPRLRFIRQDSIHWRRWRILLS
ncbi:hypothetical protein K435DRAFT_684532, partial [Dendrothele bispora CBS 962.96]